LNNTLTQVSTALDASKQVAEQNQQLRTEIDLTKQRLDLLESEIRNQQKESPAQSGTPETPNQNW
jgi:regulator of replication initiation timing